MKRDASERLDDWLKGHGRKPMVLRGARQTGKTWIVRDLARRHGLDLVEINFEKNPELADCFAGNDVGTIMKLLGVAHGRALQPERSLLFLDEIQQAPQVFPVLRWFKEDLPQLPVISAGSLLDFVLEDHSFSMPVGRIHYFYLEPMSFLEFVRATGNDPLYDHLKSVDITAPVPEPVHRRCLELYGIYRLIGGMPEVVAEWLATGDVNACMAVLADLLATLRDDFNKYGSNTDLLRKTLRATADQLGGKFVLSRVEEGVRSGMVKTALEQLCMARVLSRVGHSAANGIPLGAQGNERFFKIIGLDAGLITVQLGLGRLRPDAADSLRFVNSGALAEQFVGQQLRAALSAYGEPELFYWQRTGGRQGEIDYLIQMGERLVPLEVKAGSSGAMKSLHQFMFDKKLSLAVRLDTNPGSRQEVRVKTTQGDAVAYTLVSLPVYLAERVWEGGGE